MGVFWGDEIEEVEEKDLVEETAEAGEDCGASDVVDDAVDAVDAVGAVGAVGAVDKTVDDVVGTTVLTAVVAPAGNTMFGGLVLLSLFWLLLPPRNGVRNEGSIVPSCCWSSPSAETIKEEEAFTSRATASSCSFLLPAILPFRLEPYMLSFSMTASSFFSPTPRVYVLDEDKEVALNDSLERGAPFDSSCNVCANPSTK